MYLEGEVYIGAEYEHRNVTGKVDLSINGKSLDIPLKKISTIILRVAYWRKANQIMNWFTKHENWDDGLQSCEICGRDLLKLVETCKEVLEKREKAKDLLPTVDGFFFGDQEINDWYFEQLENTIKMLEHVVPETWYTFSASW